MTSCLPHFFPLATTGDEEQMSKIEKRLKLKAKNKVRAGINKVKKHEHEHEHEHEHAREVKAYVVKSSTGDKAAVSDKCKEAKADTGDVHQKQATSAVASATAPETVDLIPWTFKRPDKVTIKRENWNRFTSRIIAAATTEAETENTQLDAALKEALDSRDHYKQKFEDMEKFVSEFTRGFHATYGK